MFNAAAFGTSTNYDHWVNLALLSTNLLEESDDEDNYLVNVEEVE